ncbi:hypothetical protein [Nonomuraea sp. JJY05]|uniref:hypothetical protein n=1 Tax=Nonomuraea sp. JJY05 TaxID=3350255 RepID=UPI00373DFD9C
MDARFLGIADLVEVPSVAVVSNVMRAFTGAVRASVQGAGKIVLAESPDEALALKDGPPAPRFDTVNPPGLVRSVDLGGRSLLRRELA